MRRATPPAVHPLNPFVFALAVAGTAGGTVLAFLIWTRRYHGYDTRPIWWPYGEAQFHAVMRAFPAVCLICWAAIAMVVGFLLSPEKFGGGLPLLVSIGLAVFVLAVLLALTAALFNRPRFLVFPHLRDQQGLIKTDPDARC